MDNEACASEAKFAEHAIPKILALVSNVRSIPNYPLLSELKPLHECIDNISASLLRIGYFVSPGARSNENLHGKQYSRISETATRLETPLGRWGRLSVVFDYNPDFPTLHVNKTYHRLGRITVGNAHSVGWLLRDLTNIQLLLNGKSLLHAAGLSHGDRATILVGLSNTGKTTTVIDLVRRHNAKFFGDDLIVVDKEGVYPCPLTLANISPEMLPTRPQQIFQLARRALPFYENFGPVQAPVSVADFLGNEMIAAPTKISEILFLKQGARNQVLDISPIEATQLLLASNRTEFTYAASPVFCAADYLHNFAITEQAESSERQLLSDIANTSSCKLVIGNQAEFRRATEDSLQIETGG